MSQNRSLSGYWGTPSNITDVAPLFFFFQAEDGIRDSDRDWSSDVCYSDLKKGRYTLEVNADDKIVEKKDKTVNEPLQFYLSRARGIPYEIVVNQVDKDRIVGYLATPK